MIRIERQEKTAVVYFDRGEKLNAFNQQLIQALTQAAREFEQDRVIQSIVLSGTQKAFSSGMDLDDEMWDMPAASDLERRETYYSGVRLCETWERLPQVTIAAIEGMAVGAGVALALACDWRVAAQDAFLYVPEVKVGINLQWGAVPRLVSLVGPARAKQICLLCEKYSAEQACDWGLLDRIAPVGGAIGLACELASEVNKQPDVTIRMIKEAINATSNVLHRATSFADADQSQLSGNFLAARSARDRFLGKK
ncbi:MAG: enoyl-CoA hydratase/isomerase family protein [Gammaproteobacteria bacterium]|jgi:enoyl-CoA hydratase/carnithine racemase|nr:enoyl-CoA hydratase [Chromatiales bacterium]MDP7419439.1 enoyl-CoA hydratase/isomerase family protein [Gammaproteobacteria bacterium]HJP39539.1 enoyl-CoA hydratase/isomerase family protein [Gammaproteobacteria bacterium]